jgi:hypothetical protein
MLKPTTPKKISGAIKSFLRKSGLNSKPTYLPFIYKSDQYLAKKCLDNSKHATLNGLGDTVFGWMIWEDKRNKFIEAEFHSVILIDGKLVDITPRVDKEPKVMFVPDYNREPHSDDRHWYTFTNIKSHNGEIYEEALESKRDARHLT